MATDESAEILERLRGMSPDTHAMGAARRILEDCLQASDSNRLLISAEPMFLGLASALLKEADARGIYCEPVLVTLDDARNVAFASRMETRLESFDRSALICTRQTVRAYRSIFTNIGDAVRRHAHLLGINEAVYRQGLRADFGEVEQLGQRLEGRLSPTSRIEVTSAAGTDLVARPDPTAIWHNQSGVLRGPGWTNLPAGELTTCPGAVDGVFVPDGGVCMSDGLQLDRADVKRLKIHIAGGSVTDIEGPEEPARLLREHIDSGRDGRRVGQISFGTNTDVLATIGLVAQDAKLPGFHLTLSYSAPECTKASWCGELLVNLLQRKATVNVDGTPVLVDGRYVEL